MIVIDTNTSTHLAYMSLTSDSEFYLFELINKSTKEETLVCQNNIAVSDAPYKKFLFGNGSDNLNGDFEFSIVDYDYTVYSIGSRTLDKNEVIDILGKGLLRVVNPDDTVFYLDDKADYIVYQ